LLDTGSFVLAAKKITNKCDAIGNGQGKVKQSDCEENEECTFKKKKCMNAKTAAKKITNKCDAIGNGKGKIEQLACEQNEECEVKKKKCMNAKTAAKKITNKCDAIAGDGEGKVDKSDCEENVECEVKGNKCKNAKTAAKKITNKCDAIGEGKGKIEQLACEENEECEVKKNKCINVKYVSPKFRWIPYAELDSAQLVLVKALDYTEKTWNVMGTNKIEKLVFEDLDSYFEEGSQKVAEQLGFGVETWDCDVNHYGGYYWSGLKEYKLAKYWMALGWNEASWKGDEVPPNTNDMKWVELTLAQQVAAMELCYRQESWDGTPIPQWKK